MSDSSEPPDEVLEAMGAAPEPSVEHRRVLISLFDLSSRQRRTIAAALTLIAAVALGWICIKLSSGVIGFVGRFSSVFLPLVTAFIMAMMIKPYFEWLHRQSDKITPTIAVGVVYLTFFIPLAILLFFFGSFLFKQTTELVTDFPAIMQNAQSNVTTVVKNNENISVFWEKHNLSDRASALAKERAEELMVVTGDFFRKILRFGGGAFTRAAGLLGWFVLPVYLGFFLMMRPINRSERHEWFSFLKHETREDIIYLIDQFVEIMVSFFRGQLVIALIQATLFGVGFQLVGLRFGFVIGFALGLLNVIPYLGSMVGLAVALPTAFFQSGTWHGLEGGLLLVLLVLLVFMVVQSIEGYLLTPRIMGDRTGLHPMAIIVAIFFWGTAFDGIIGMILAIPLTAFLVVFWRLAKRKELLQGWF